MSRKSVKPSTKSQSKKTKKTSRPSDDDLIYRKGYTFGISRGAIKLLDDIHRTLNRGTWQLYHAAFASLMQDGISADESIMQMQVIMESNPNAALLHNQLAGLMNNGLEKELPIIETQTVPGDSEEQHKAVSDDDFLHQENEDGEGRDKNEDDRKGEHSEHSEHDEADQNEKDVEDDEHEENHETCETHHSDQVNQDNESDSDLSSIGAEEIENLMQTVEGKIGSVTEASAPRSRVTRCWKPEVCMPSTGPTLKKANETYGGVFGQSDGRITGDIVMEDSEMADESKMVEKSETVEKSEMNENSETSAEEAHPGLLCEEDQSAHSRSPSREVKRQDIQNDISEAAHDKDTSAQRKLVHTSPFQAREHKFLKKQDGRFADTPTRRKFLKIQQEDRERQVLLDKRQKTHHSSVSHEPTFPDGKDGGASAAQTKISFPLGLPEDHMQVDDSDPPAVEIARNPSPISDDTVGKKAKESKSSPRPLFPVSDWSESSPWPYLPSSVDPNMKGAMDRIRDDFPDEYFGSGEQQYSTGSPAMQQEYSIVMPNADPATLAEATFEETARREDAHDIHYAQGVDVDMNWGEIEEGLTGAAVGSGLLKDMLGQGSLALGKPVEDAWLEDYIDD
ncbi:hypothetical protein BCR34DRAFT_601592 [Clohesyomyces aquaticus]|uniref:Uncharacterized protein n=1 Tax=Clohesyomyces aquaticus TaxID=1231657 RepID=A0A1Y1ZLL9_9PLEO|nr:hypothetical protein BCR34DRAFT_601592 [Clohesyomyces aquaticus]